MQRPTLTFTITLTLTLHLLLNSQLVTCDELTYWRVDQTLTSAGCPLLPYRYAFWSTGVQRHLRRRTMSHGNPRATRKWGGNIPICFKGKLAYRILTLKCSKIDFFQLMLGEPDSASLVQCCSVVVFALLKNQMILLIYECSSSRRHYRPISKCIHKNMHINEP